MPVPRSEAVSIDSTLGTPLGAPSVAPEWHHASAPLEQYSWPSEPASGRGRSHGTSSHHAFDRWFRYPAGFASDYVGLLLDRLKVEDGTVVDCFTGSGVTGTAARLRGLGFAGIEAHPLIAELARLKLTPSATGQAVRDLAASVEVSAGRVIESAPRGWQRVVAEEPDLVRRSFSDETLFALVSMRQAVVSHASDPAAQYLKWALLATLRDVAGVKVGWPYQRPGVPRKPRHVDALKRFEARVQAIASDLDSAATDASEALSAQVVTGDSRDSAVWAQLSGSGTACVSSPPYLNNFDYADATRLELYFWGEVTTWGDMCREVRADMVTATTQQSSVREKADSLDVLRGRAAAHPAPTKEIIGLVEDIATAKKERQRRSKEYDQVAPAYFIAMWDILHNLHDFLKPGSKAVWLVGDSAPYGVYIDTPRLIGQISQAVGFTYTEDVHLRVRGDRWRQSSDRHNVKLAERLIVMEKPGSAASSAGLAG